MLIDLIVLAASLLFGGFVLAWSLSPALRRRIESPKYRFLQEAQAFEREHPVSAGGVKDRD